MAEEISNDEVQRVQSFIAEQVKATLAEMQSAEAQNQPTSQQEAHRQMKEVIDPYVKPDLDRVQMTALAAGDESRFYRKNSDAAEYEEQIESTFEQLMKVGRPMSRNDIYKYIVGKEATDNPDKFHEKMTEKRKAQLEKAERATDFGYASGGREKEISTFRDFKSLPIEEMEKALEGVVF